MGLHWLVNVLSYMLQANALNSSYPDFAHSPVILSICSLFVVVFKPLNYNSLNLFLVFLRWVTH